MQTAVATAASPKVPSLPIDDIRRAIAAHEWPQAEALMAVHQRELVETVGQVDWSSVDRGPWLELLHAQRTLTAELQAERDRVAQALARLNEDHRGARAWLKELA